MLQDVSKQLGSNLPEKPVVVMDAGIATEENLTIVKSEKFDYDYVCVSRLKPAEYEIISDIQTITDNRDNKIHLTKVLVPDKQDYFLHIKSEQKQKKEQSIDDKPVSYTHLTLPTKRIV